MRSQRCTQCGTKLDVSRMEEGSKFACSNCGAVLVAGEVKAVRRSLSDSDQTFKRSSKAEPEAKPSVSRRRRAPADAEAATPRTRGERAAPDAKSKTPLFIGAGVVIVGVIVAVVMSGGGGSGPGGSKSNPAQDWWAGVQPKIATASADDLRAMLKEAQSKGYDANPAFWMAKADSLYAALAKKDVNDPAANTHMGRVSLQSYPGFKSVWEGFDQHLTRMPEKYARFYEKYGPQIEEGKDVWFSKEDFSSAGSLLDSFQEWRKKAESDPSPELIQKGLSRVDSFAKGFGAFPVVELPYIVFLASRELAKTGDAAADKERIAAKQQSFGPRAASVKKRVKAVHAAFQERIVKPLGLKPIEKGRAFYVYAFDDPAHLAEVVKMGSSLGVQLDMGSSLLFFYRTYDPMAFGAIPATPEADKYFTSDLGHILVHQLHKYYAQGEKSYQKYFDQWNRLWLTEGIAEYLGGGASDDGKFTGVSPRRASLLRAMDNAGVPLFTIREIVRFASYQRYARFMSDSWFPAIREEENPPQTMNELIAAEQPHFSRNAFQTQAWYLTYFLNEYSDGKYREKFLDLVRTMLTGQRKPTKYGSGKWKTTEDAFAEIMGLKTPEDWEKLQEEYDNFIDRVPGE